MLSIYRFSERDEQYKHVLLKRKITYNDDRAEPQEREGRGDDSLSRTRRLFEDYAYCNYFPLFCTFTFDSDKHDREDFKGLKKKLCKFFNNFRNRVDDSFRYHVIPEYHEDGAVHFHGLCTVPVGICSPLEIDWTIKHGRRKGEKIKVTNKHKKYMRWPAYSARFGYFSASYIEDYAKTVSYCSSYITKAFKDKRMKNIQLLVHSQGLKKPELVYQGDNAVIFKPDYENDFCAVAWRNELQTSEFYRHWSYTEGEFIRDMTVFEVDAPIGKQLAIEDVTPHEA